jgi:hypothetical protein
MSPTVFKEGSYRFFFYSNEETRIHVHVRTNKGEAKFWLAPIVTLANSINLSPRELNKIKNIIEERKHEIEKAWTKQFGS